MIVLVEQNIGVSKQLRLVLYKCSIYLGDIQCHNSMLTGDIKSINTELKTSFLTRFSTKCSIDLDTFSVTNQVTNQVGVTKKA